MNRRSFFRATLATLAAPAIVRASSLMKVRPYYVHVADDPSVMYHWFPQEREILARSAGWIPVMSDEI